MWWFKPGFDLIFLLVLYLHAGVYYIILTIANGDEKLDRSQLIYSLPIPFSFPPLLPAPPSTSLHPRIPRRPRSPMMLARARQRAEEKAVENQRRRRKRRRKRRSAIEEGYWGKSIGID